MVNDQFVSFSDEPTFPCPPPIKTHNFFLFRFTKKSESFFLSLSLLCLCVCVSVCVFTFSSLSDLSDYVVRSSDLTWTVFGIYDNILWKMLYGVTHTPEKLVWVSHRFQLPFEEPRRFKVFFFFFSLIVCMPELIKIKC